ncbi:Uu.00g143360.m01.CDS01 [Anthostomella pinea]|uniref:Uu.00g143360.m01.CDS01 n=1 Tax=Anthostomella pinea TaxID=933095 RepID=A0AAI8VK59_9PEZI|nr:Uu.00g143360.m01.CDS01 [Anthostomella pinea]
MDEQATEKPSGAISPKTMPDHVEIPTKLTTTSSLEELQTDEQRRILDTITQVRKCGLESIISLPQIVVCGDQSAGKSSVLEALTEIPFPRNDNLCTRFATEISLRHESRDNFTICVIPDNARPEEEQKKIKAFSQSITDFSELPAVMEDAMKVMGITDSEQSSGGAFSRDTLSIEMCGPKCPHLTLVDIPGLIQTSTKGVSDADVALVAEITDHYISQPRTICLAVVSATHDAANQPILQRARTFDKHGERTLGVITKPDRLAAGSGAETSFLGLARNEDVFFKLGWHVVKNRQFEERSFSLEERNFSEMTFFRTSDFKRLPKETVGIDALRVRLSHLLFEHVKNELPRLKDDLERALEAAMNDMKILGDARSTVADCRAYLVQLSMDCHEICKAALNGNYEHDYFKAGSGEPFSLDSGSTIARFRAVVQYMNKRFADHLRTEGHKYQINLAGSNEDEARAEDAPTAAPKALSKKGAMEWVKKMLLRSRGTELLGNFNPHLIGELFWEQSEGWGNLANDHIEQVSQICDKFLAQLLQQKAPQDVKDRLWSSTMLDALKERRKAAMGELENLVRDKKDFPINYNHYYTENLHKRHRERMKARVLRLLPGGTPHTSYEKCSRGEHFSRYDVEVDRIVSACSQSTMPDMEDLSCEEALDCLLSIYKVQQKTFVANVVTQVIERHILRDLDKVFSPMVVTRMNDSEVEAITSEPPATKRQRVFLTDRMKKLEDGRDIFRGVLGSAPAAS